MRVMRLILGWIIGFPVFLLGADCAAMAILGQLGRLGPILDIPNHFAPLWLIGALIAALAGLAYPPDKRRWISGAGLVGIVAALLLIVPEYLRDTGPKAPANAAGQIKVVQFNTWQQNHDPEAVVRWLKAVDPDIATLEETTPYLRQRIAQEARWNLICDECDEMILTKATPLPTAYRPPNPALSIGVDPFIAQAKFRDARGEYAVVATHHDWPLGYWQRWQERRLVRAVDQFPRQRTIVGGDFNSTPWSFERQRRDRRLGLTRRERALFSWPANIMVGGLRVPAFLPIDHVYAGPGWATVKVERGPYLGSDHYPLIVTLAPRSAPP